MSAWRAMALFVVALVAALAGFLPFAGALGIVPLFLSRRARESPPVHRRLASVTVVLAGVALASTIFWGLVFFAPTRDAPRGSSPVVRIFDGTSDRVVGAFATGSLYPWAERRDIASAPRLVAIDGEYRLRIESVGDAIANIDSVALMIVDHREGIDVLPTTNQTFAIVKSTEALATPLAFSDAMISGEPVRSWNLEFSRPKALHALLVLEARSTELAEVAFARYLATMGQGMDSFMAWVTKETCTDACRQEVWDDETTRLGISLWVSTSAGARHAIAPTGSIATRRFAVPLDVPSSSERLLIRLESTPRFWEITNATLSPDEGEDISALTLLPKSAFVVRAESDPRENVLDKVRTSDRVRALVGRGERLDARFDAPPVAPDFARSAFVAVRAHYRIPTGGKPLINTAAVLAHRVGLTSLPRFSAALPNTDVHARQESASTINATPTAGE